MTIVREHWMTFWNDCCAMITPARATSTAAGSRSRAWLYKALKTDMPYDQFVAQLITPTPERKGSPKASSGAAWSTQPDAADAGGAEHLAGVHGREPQVRQLPRQLHQPMEACRLPTAWPALLRTSRWRWTAATSRPARWRR